MRTVQEKFWESNFGQSYTKRNLFTGKQFDAFYIKRYGVSRSEMNKRFLSGIKIDTVLEVGSNVGIQLSLLQSQGYKNLYGIDIDWFSVEFAKKHTKHINILQGSAFDIPFKDGCFDLVFTSGVLIHIPPPKDIKKAMMEIYRTSKKYIWGFEYFNDTHKGILYRNNKNRLWKGNFAKMYLDAFPDLTLVKRESYAYLQDENVDEMFLLKK